MERREGILVLRLLANSAGGFRAAVVRLRAVGLILRSLFLFQFYLNYYSYPLFKKDCLSMLL